VYRPIRRPVPDEQCSVPPRIRIRDDRDRPVGLLPAGLPLALRDWAAALPPFRLRTAPRRLLRAFTHGPGLAVLGALAIVATLITVWSADHAVGFGLIIFTPVAVPMLTAALLATRGLLGLGGWLPGAMRASLLARHRCAACGYTLNGLAPDPDGCLTCPECASAWDAAYLGPAAHAGPTVVVLEDW
jgi:hypothetical protein